MLLACQPSIPPEGTWTGHATIADGRAIPFSFEMSLTTRPPTAAFLIDEERTPVPEVFVHGDSILFVVDEYHAAFRLLWDGTALRGVYERYRTDTTGFPVIAMPGSVPAKEGRDKPDIPLVGSFAFLREGASGVDSSSTAVFWARGDSIFGTIVSPSGDDGLMAGVQSGDTVRLSRFTGWQSLFLEIVREGTSWRGLRFMRELPPSSFRLLPRTSAASDVPNEPATRLRKGVKRFTFSGITAEGDTITDASERFRGRPLIVDIMGTWCHNCLDAAPVLQKLYEEFNGNGLEIVSLAFELRDDVPSGLRNLDLFRKRHGITYTMLYCGDISRENVEERIGAQLENFGAYPTAIFIDRNGKVVSTHKGFRGPGTGEGFQREIGIFYAAARSLTHE